ncbi:hypothetical protein PFICI_15166 [Pestalotiopsis fici W106-1]|uniref:Uncharacterized protein n=1 Tax=Pestalotiopsis fici (strain W106-1 / CGMCC3.15140) TaxID=1229662 RepID=W3WKA0_PESFW|nr:uncharacterized protein PFICI_15166 [Pestalotiopsis fici W106-1]ETS73221.1 hypothetical protein PFICI_15166 [Pestalotiopsis fici W106-1]
MVTPATSSLRRQRSWDSGYMSDAGYDSPSRRLPHEGPTIETSDTTNYIRRKCDWEVDSVEESEDDGYGEHKDVDRCQYTFSQDQGKEYYDGYLAELQEELEGAQERLLMVEDKLKFWRRLYWRSRDEYYFSHGSSSNGSEQGDCPDDVSDDWQSLFDDKGEDGGDTRRKFVDELTWSDIKLSEFHLYQLELEVDEANEDCSMINAELVLCNFRIENYPPETWHFDKESGLLIWNSNRNQEVTADNFLSVPDHKRSLRYGRTKYN